MDSVMLAHKFDPAKHAEKVIGWYMSEKLDGVRAVFDGQNFWTRNGKILQAPLHFSGPLEKMGKIWNGLKLDGELYMGRGNFNECSGTVRRHDDMWAGITYQVFDIITPGVPFKGRYMRLRELVEMWQIPHVEAVAQETVQDLDHIWRHHELMTLAGGEGSMLKNPDSFYSHNRSVDLLKVKKFQEMEAMCIGLEGGKGKYTGMVGALRLRTVDGKEFSCGSGLTDEQRANAKEFLTQAITVKYFELSKDGIPRFPIFKGIRFDA